MKYLSTISVIALLVVGMSVVNAETTTTSPNANHNTSDYANTSTPTGKTVAQVK